MRSHAAWILVTGLLLFTAGCIGIGEGEDAAQPAGTDDPATGGNDSTSSRNQDPTSETASETNTTSPNASSPANDTSGPSTQLVKIPFSQDGTLGANAFVCSSPACPGTGIGNDRWFPTDPDGTVRGLNLTMTWNATTPAMEQMRLGVSYGGCDGDGLDCQEASFVDGASPLELSVDEVDANGTLAVWFWTPSRTPPSTAGTYVSHPQDVHIQGAFTSEVQTPSTGGSSYG